MTVLDTLRNRAGDLVDKARIDRVQGRRHVNVSEDERVLSVAAGAAMAALGISRNTWPGLLVAGLGGALIYRGVTGECPGYNAMQVDTSDDLSRSGIDESQTFTIDKSREELYRYWRNFENLPRIMSHLKLVHVIDDRKSHWVASAPAIAGGHVEWDAEITDDVENERIAWRSLPNADVDNEGSVQFEASPRGTVVRVKMRYLAPAGRLGRWLAKLSGEGAGRQIREDLRNFKRFMEVGELPTIQGQPHGSCRGLGRLFSE